MKRLTCFTLVIASCCTVVCAVSAQQLYKSVGPDGKVVYSDRPPAEGRVEKTMKFANLPTSALPASAASYVEQLRRMQAGASPSVPATGVVLYSASWCGYCRQAKAYLAAKAIAFQEIDIDTGSGMSSFAQAGGAGGGIPFLLAGGHSVRGFNVAAYDAFFAKRK